MGREYVVFCLDGTEYGQGGTFFQFLHEADYLLLSPTQHVDKGNITVTEAFEWLDPYLNDAHIREQIPFLKGGVEPRRSVHRALSRVVNDRIDACRQIVGGTRTSSAQNLSRLWRRYEGTSEDVNRVGSDESKRTKYHSIVRRSFTGYV